MSEATAVMTSHEPFAVAPSQSQPMLAPYTADSAASYRPVGSSPTPNHLGDQKRKRGRPRKYGPDGSMPGAIMVSAPQPISVSMPQPQTQTQTLSPPPSQVPVGAGSASASPTVKKARGRPPGSSNKKKQFETMPTSMGSTGIGFVPHVLNVNAGEDVSSKIMAFSQNGPRAVCILSANGAISNVTLRQAATSGGTATYEGRFDILSLTGSFMLTEVGGQKSRTGGLSTTLAGPDGRVFGGCVAGLLIAASPVQVIVGSFLADSRKEPKSASYVDPLSVAPPKVVNMGGATGPGGSSSPSRGTFSGSSGGPTSPLNLSSGAYNNHHPQAMSGMPWK